MCSACSAHLRNSTRFTDSPASADSLPTKAIFRLAVTTSWETKFGPLDVLGTIGKDHDWAELAATSDSVQLDSTLLIAVLDLPTQITIKEEVGGEKDALMLPILRRTLAERGG